MTLREYLDWKKISPEEFGASIGVSRIAVCRYLDGSRRPNWRTVLPKIIEATDGRVTADSFLVRQQQVA